MGNSQYLVNESRFLFTEIDDQGVLFYFETNEYLNLNSTFCSIFKYLRENLGLREIKEKLIQEYDVPGDVCEAELLECLETLIQKGLIREKSAA